MQVMPDVRLFTPIKDEPGGGPVDYLKRSSATRDQASLLYLSGEIARLGSKIQMDLHGPGIRGDRKVTMREYLCKQKLRIPIPVRYLTLVASPITEEAVSEYLREWNFHPESIQIHIRKRKTWWRYGCYVEVTFGKK